MEQRFPILMVPEAHEAQECENCGTKVKCRNCCNHVYVSGEGHLCRACGKDGDKESMSVAQYYSVCALILDGLFKR